MKYKTIRVTKMLTSPPPNGRDMGMLAAGAEIESTWTASGWRHFYNAQGQNRWILAADCVPTEQPDPPDEPEQPPANPVVYYQVRQSTDSGKTWGNPKYFKEVDGV